MIKLICKMSQEQLYYFMKKWLSAYKYKIKEIAEGGFIAMGTLPIGLVAHLDTVGYAPPTEIYHDKEQNVMWSPQLLGADDRAGVYAIIRLVKAGFRPTIILTLNEETGCLGAKKMAEMDNPLPPHTRYLIQLDRRGSNDAVFYSCNNKKFIKYITSFGFQEAQGTYSDISVLCPSWKICGVNLSVGYYDEHSTNERLFLTELYTTIDKVKKMLTQNPPKFKPSFQEYSYKRYSYSDFYCNQKECLVCGEPITAATSVKIQPTKGSVPFRVCEDCYIKYYAN